MLDLLIITGASKGIGESVANHCSYICKTMIGISSSDKINSLNYNNCKTISLKLDLTDYNNVYNQLINILSTLYNINSLGIVLCGAQLGNNGGLLNTDLDEWNKLYNCNVLGNLSVVKACSNIIKSNIKTRIALFAGGGACFGYPDFFAYSLSKVAIVRAVENLSLELSKINNDVSVIGVSPGAVDTSMLKQVIASGAFVRTKTDISEPTNFIYNFLTDKFPSKEISGRLLHVRDDISNLDLNNMDMCKLRRIEKR